MLQRAPPGELGVLGRRRLRRLLQPSAAMTSVVTRRCRWPQLRQQLLQRALPAVAPHQRQCLCGRSAVSHSGCSECDQYWPTLSSSKKQAHLGVAFRAVGRAAVWWASVTSVEVDGQGGAECHRVSQWHGGITSRGATEAHTTGQQPPQPGVTGIPHTQLSTNTPVTSVTR